MSVDTAGKRARLRDDLIAAAEAAIAAGGLSALKARALAEAAGCAVGAIYNVFPDLDALIFAVNARTLGSLDQVLAATVRPGTDPETAMRRLALAYHGFSRAERRRWTAVFAHQIPDGSTPPDWYLGVVGKLFRHIEGPLTELLPGSTPEMRAGLAHPETLIEDRPSRFGTYAPSNFDRGYQGTVPTRVALQMSLNIPAVALMEAVGPQRFFSRLEQAGIRPVLPRGEVPGLAVGLGGVGLRLSDLASLYAGLARGGEMPALVERLGAPQPAGRPSTRTVKGGRPPVVLTTSCSISPRAAPRSTRTPSGGKAIRRSRVSPSCSRAGPKRRSGAGNWAWVTAGAAAGRGGIAAGVPSRAKASKRMGAAAVRPVMPGTEEPSGRPTQTATVRRPSKPTAQASRKP